MSRSTHILNNIYQVSRIQMDWLHQNNQNHQHFVAWYRRCAESKHLWLPTVFEHWTEPRRRPSVIRHTTQTHKHHRIVDVAERQSTSQPSITKPATGLASRRRTAAQIWKHRLACVPFFLVSSVLFSILHTRQWTHRWSVDVRHWMNRATCCASGNGYVTLLSDEFLNNFLVAVSWRRAVLIVQYSIAHIWK